MLKLLILDRPELRAAIASLDAFSDAAIEWIAEVPESHVGVSGPIIVTIEALQELHARIRRERFSAFGQVARGLGHELGNILLRIVGKADLALMESDVPRIREHLGVLMDATDRATLVVRNLQSLGKAQFHLRPLELGSLVSGALSTLRSDAGKQGLGISCDPVGALQVNADPAALAQAVSNVALNGMQAMSSGGKLRVSLERASRSDNPVVLIRIEDQGRGIPPETLPRIFDLGFTTRGGRGAGLGLSIAQEILRAHGGGIEVARTSEAGTEFVLWLPEWTGRQP